MLGEATLVQTGSHISSEAGILPNESANQAERMLRDLEAAKGFGVHVFVVRQVSPGMQPIDVAKETYEGAGYGPKDVVVVLNAKTARGGIFAGPEARALLSEDVAKSIAEETFLFRAREEKFGAALVDVADREEGGDEEGEEEVCGGAVDVVGDIGGGTDGAVFLVPQAVNGWGETVSGARATFFGAASQCGKTHGKRRFGGTGAARFGPVLGSSGAAPGRRWTR
eukprot:ctg_673.g433